MITNKHNTITESIIKKSIEIHRELGPGLLESTYEACLEYELLSIGIIVKRQVPIPLLYKNISIDCGYRIDLLAEDLVIIELKSVEKIHPIHKAQLLTYLKLSGLKLGLLINFNVEILKNGIYRLIN